MYNTPPPNLMHGIQLVQAGRKAEALPYLRYAAQVEPLTAEGWLWLAAATDHMDEYRHCVFEALRLDPYHPVANRMRNALDALAHPAPGPPPVAPAYADAVTPGWAVPREQAPPRRRASRLRRAVRVLVIALVVGGCIGVSAALVASGVLHDLVRDVLRVEDMHTLDFVVGESPGYHFRVEVPESWQPANADNPSWRTTRETLVGEFPQAGDLWDVADERFSVVVRDPVYGTMMPEVRLVETDPARLRDNGMVPALALYEIRPLPDAPPGSGDANDVCARMRALEVQFVAGGGYTAVAGGVVLDTTLTSRSDRDDCVFSVERRYADLRPEQVPLALSPELAPDATREIVIAVPVGTERFAVWQLLYADSAHEDYAYALERILNTLVYLPEG